jgi:hypothetical protein
MIFKRFKATNLSFLTMDFPHLPTYVLYFFTFIQLIYGWKYPWVVPLGTTLPKSQESWTQFKKHNSIYLYIGLFDWIMWAMFSPPMHTLMKNNEHP